jgi:cation:H+ antiporter
VRIGEPGLAVGDLLGSSLMNLAILAVADLIRRSKQRLISPLGAAHALSATMSIALTALAGMAIAVRPGLALGPLGLFAWALLAVYLFGLRLVYFDQHAAAAHAPAAEPRAERPERRRRVVRASLGYAGCAAALFLSAPFLASAADRIAERYAVDHSFVGTAFLSLTTSLPELVATLAAIRLGSYDLALGNIFGSNSFNLLLLVPLDALQPGPLLSAVQPLHAVTAFGVILATSVAVLAQLYRFEQKRRLVDPGAETILFIVALTLGVVHHLGRG